MNASPVQGYPQQSKCRQPFIHLGGERHYESPGGGVLPYKGLMGTCGQLGYIFWDFCLKQGIDFYHFVLNRVSFLGKFFNRVQFWAKCLKQGFKTWTIFCLKQGQGLRSWAAPPRNNTVSWQGFVPGLFQLESSTLTIKPPCLPQTYHTNPHNPSCYLFANKKSMASLVSCQQFFKIL